ncbi:MAG: DUF4065 domain-containing protein [Rhodobacteraceae bacterium]|nr:DUF4065 domain-containing protein [Paracoccaceae bacterium]
MADNSKIRNATQKPSVPVSVLSVAKRMGEESEWKLTNLALQKLSYIAHMICLGRHDIPLVHGEFQAWDLGPVHPQLYRVANQFGSRYVQQNVFQNVPNINDNITLELIDNVVNTLSDSTPRLVTITHWEKGAWAKHYTPNVKGISIPNEDIHKEYKDRLSEQKQ